MAKKIEKTNAARLLDRAKISYQLIPYEFDENDLAGDALHHNIVGDGGADATCANNGDFS